MHRIFDTQFFFILILAAQMSKKMADIFHTTPSGTRLFAQVAQGFTAHTKMTIFSIDNLL